MAAKNGGIKGPLPSVVSSHAAPSAVHDIYDLLPAESRAVVLIRSGDRFQRYELLKTNKKPVVVTDNFVVFDGVSFKVRSLL